MKEKSNYWLIGVFLVLVALSRWPGLFPPGFSMVYGFVFCAGVYVPKSMAWWLPLGMLLVTDVALNFYYESKGATEVWTWTGMGYMLFNYLGYAGIIWLGRGFKPQSKFLSLLGGGIFGALLFYLVTNTVSWLFDSAYPKTFSGWLIAVIKGVNGWPETWTFFRNTLLSSGLVTGLFVAAMKLCATESPADKEAGVRADDPEGEPEAKEAGA